MAAAQIDMNPDAMLAVAQEHERLELLFEFEELVNSLVENPVRSEEHTSELQSLMRISYAVFCLKKQTLTNKNNPNYSTQEHTANHRSQTSHNLTTSTTSIRTQQQFNVTYID